MISQVIPPRGKYSKPIGYHILYEMEEFEPTLVEFYIKLIRMNQPLYIYILFFSLNNLFIEGVETEKYVIRRLEHCKQRLIKNQNGTNSIDSENDEKNGEFFYQHHILLKIYVNKKTKLIQSHQPRTTQK